MVYIQTVLILLFPCVMLGQYYNPSETLDPVSVSMYQNTDIWTDSILIGTLPSRSVIESIVLVADSSLGGGDNYKIGVQGERVLTPHLFGNFFGDDDTTGTIRILNHYSSLQNIAGGQYTHEDGVTVITADNDVPVQAMGLRNQPIQDFDTTLSMSSSTIKAYQGGRYDVYSTISFSASAANRDIHAHITLNETKLFNVAFMRYIGTPNDVGDAGHLGNVILSEGDSITLSMESSVAPVTISINHASFILKKMNDFAPYQTNVERKIYLYTTSTTGRLRVFIQYRRYQ